MIHLAQVFPKTFGDVPAVLCLKLLFHKYAAMGLGLITQLTQEIARLALDHTLALAKCDKINIGTLILRVIETISVFFESH